MPLLWLALLFRKFAVDPYSFFLFDIEFFSAIRYKILSSRRTQTERKTASAAIFLSRFYSAFSLTSISYSGITRTPKSSQPCFTGRS